MVEFQLPKLTTRVRFRPSLQNCGRVGVIMNSQCRLGLVLVAMTLGFPHVSVGTRPADQPGTTQRGIYHKVQKGETFWRIAKAYQVDIDDIVRSNNIPNVARIEENQLIFIPRAERVVPIPKEASSVSPEAAGDELDGRCAGRSCISSANAVPISAAGSGLKPPRASRSRPRVRARSSSRII